MGHILGPKSYVSLATLVRLLLAMTIEIWHRECGPFWPIFAVFLILDKVWNTLSPWGKGPSRGRVVILVAYDQGSIPLEFHIWASGLARVMQPAVGATLGNFAFLALFCPVAGPSPRGTASQTPMHGTEEDIKARDSRLGLTRSPRKPTLVGHRRWPILPIWAF